MVILCIQLTRYVHYIVCGHIIQINTSVNAISLILFHSSIKVRFSQFVLVEFREINLVVLEFPGLQLLPKQDVQFHEGTAFGFWETEERPGQEDKIDSTSQKPGLSLPVSLCWIEDVWAYKVVDHKRKVVCVSGQSDGLVA